MTTHDVIIRHLRLRRGPSTNGGECTGDTILLFGAERVIIDHVSAGWTTDQIMTMWPATNVTIQEGAHMARIHEAFASDLRWNLPQNGPFSMRYQPT